MRWTADPSKDERDRTALHSVTGPGRLLPPRPPSELLRRDACVRTPRPAAYAGSSGCYLLPIVPMRGTPVAGVLRSMSSGSTESAACPDA